MKKIYKILISIISIFALINFLFWSGGYYIFGCSYLYYDQDVLNHIYSFIIASIVVIIIFLLVLLMMIKGSKICAVLLIVFSPLALFSSFLIMLYSSIIGTYGCSYTEDIVNYNKYDYDIAVSYFPSEITDEMEVVSFSYFYKYVDRNQVDINLEVKFENKEKMDKYLNIAINSLSESGKEVQQRQNSFNPKYTDIFVMNRDYYVLFEESSDHKYVEMDYKIIIYSYDELTIIYNYTDIGSDVIIGDDPNDGKYYPKILKRFNVEFNLEKNFKYE